MADYDWDRIEIEYRANKLSNRELSRKYGPSESTIRKRANKHKWQRDLAKKVQERTNEKIVTRAARPLNSDDEQVIEEIADRNAGVVESHRSDINKGRHIAGLLMNELFNNSQHHESLSQIVEQAADEEEWSEKRFNAVQRAISLPQRAATMRDLATTMKTLQGLERTAFGIDGKESDELTYEERLRNLLGDEAES